MSKYDWWYCNIQLEMFLAAVIDGMIGCPRWFFFSQILTEMAQHQVGDWPLTECMAGLADDHFCAKMTPRYYNKTIAHELL